MQGLGYNIGALNRCGRNFGSLRLQTPGRPGPAASGELSGNETSADVALQSPRSGLSGGASVREIQEMGGEPQSPELARPRRGGQIWSDVVSMGMDAGASGFEQMHSPVSLISPTTILSGEMIHPAFRLPGPGSRVTMRDRNQI
jgi:hypothetical protein